MQHLPVVTRKHCFIVTHENSSGPSMEPWGSPCLTDRQEEEDPAEWTYLTRKSEFLCLSAKLTNQCFNNITYQFNSSCYYCDKISLLQEKQLKVFQLNCNQQKHFFLYFLHQSLCLFAFCELSQYLTYRCYITHTVIFVGLQFVAVTVNYQRFSSS